VASSTIKSRTGVGIGLHLRRCRADVYKKNGGKKQYSGKSFHNLKFFLKV
jgi:hypothetical protein